MASANAYTTKTTVELADVVRRFGPAYTSRYGHATLPSQKRALFDIGACATGALGGSLYRCDGCNESFWRHHCCRNRACPKCQGSRTREWLEKRETELLPCDYFHGVATVPSELREAFRQNQKFMYGLLMRVSAQAVKELCEVNRHLGGLPGILAVLHTWTGRLSYHPHVHMLITGGGITPDGESWESSRGKFLVPVDVLSRKIAALFCDGVKAERPELLATIPKRAWRRKWVSFIKHYGHGNDAVLHYLSRYVFRTAISNSRILAMDATHVTFRHKDRKHDTWRTVRLKGVAFLRRFLQHVLPRGFHKVRYYGLWHSSKRKLSARVWMLLMLDRPVEAITPIRIADVLESLDQLADLTERIEANEADARAGPRCPHCGSVETVLVETVLLTDRGPPPTTW
jgi:hypothetical protein